jgi:eukaryotic-like serine/threonine-protein kinase
VLFLGLFGQFILEVIVHTVWMTVEQKPKILDLNDRIRIIQSHDDFPALSNTISEINEVVSSDTSSTQALTSIILEDFSLTNNLLKVVNTVSYGQFGGKISTISKAVVILGFDVVRDIATALIVLDFLQNKAQSAQIADNVISAYFVGLTSRQITIHQQAANYEEAMICGIFYHLGHLLTIFYFFDESQKINELIAEGVPESEASRTVLGVSYNNLGAEVAKIWKLPQRIIYGMQHLPDGKVKAQDNGLNQLNLTVNLASELTAIAACNHKKEKHKSIQGLVEKYNKSLRVDVASLQKVLEESLKEVSASGNIVKVAAIKSKWIKRVTDYTNGTLSTKTQINSNLDDEISNDPSTNDKQKAKATESKASAESQDGEMILQAGIQDVINTIVGEYKLNDVLQMILETMYRGLKCHRACMFVRNAKNNTMQARSGYGHDIETVIPSFQFPIHFTPDVFHLSIDKGADIVIKDTQAEPIASKIPQWYKQITSAKSFLLLPVMINNKAVGCFYAEMMTINGFDESSKILGLLRTLRNQAVLAIKQS